MTAFTRRRAVALGLGAAALPPSLRAQPAWPTGPVTFVVGYAPGGSNDINARELAALMSPILGQQVIVDNKAGANGSLGLRNVAAARPDGYTLSYTSAQTIVVNPWVQKGMIDTLTTLLPICQTTDDRYVLVANPKVLASTAAELVALARREPRKLTYSSAGIGSGNHLAAALFTEAAGVDVTHVPYRGTGPALPDVATLKEQGIDALITGWHGLFAPAGTPEALLDTIARHAKRAMMDPRWAAAMAKDGVEAPPGRTRAAWAGYIAREHAFWGRKLKTLKIELD